MKNIRTANVAVSVPKYAKPKASPVVIPIARVPIDVATPRASMNEMYGHLVAL
ncbi:hypothetical protein [Subtercola boreus]|uniref:hypothetical protein n=1 Tax=Subtercola boreus TaxID=120213 RepID=UPI0014733CB3|nr:hypothetical protein [Subtercola boreus]